MSLLGSLLQEAHEQGRKGEKPAFPADDEIDEILKDEGWPEKCFQSVKDMIFEVLRKTYDAAQYAYGKPENKATRTQTERPKGPK